MCRFALYLGPPVQISRLVTEPTHSLIRQSFESRELEEPLNGDGFGIAWFVPGLEGPPPVFKEVSPAWSNRNLLDLARATVTHCLLAHVRAATPGIPVTALNCHPFAWDRFAFMHNGALGGWPRVRRPLRESLSDEAYDRVEGSTDSEHLFALFSDKHRELTEASPLERMAAALVEAIRATETLRQRAGVTQPSRLNLALADGERAVAVRFISDDPERAHSLYVHTGAPLNLGGSSGTLFPDADAGRAVLVASEPLSEDASWRRVKPNHLLLIEGGRVEERSIEV